MKIDLTQLKLVSRGNQQFVKKMLLLFTSMVPKSIESISKCIEAEDWERLSDVAHSIKPTIDTLNIAELKKPIRELELKSKNEQDPEEIRLLARKVIDVLSQALEEVDDEIKKIE